MKTMLPPVEALVDNCGSITKKDRALNLAVVNAHIPVQRFSEGTLTLSGVLRPQIDN
jgi:hypothetical protein